MSCDSFSAFMPCLSYSPWWATMWWRWPPPLLLPPPLKRTTGLFCTAASSPWNTPPSRLGYIVVHSTIKVEICCCSFHHQGCGQLIAHSTTNVGSWVYNQNYMYIIPLYIFNYHCFIKISCLYHYLVITIYLADSTTRVAKYWMFLGLLYLAKIFHCALY